MIVDDLNRRHIAVFPPETDAPLIVDTNAVLALAFAFQGLQPISRWHAQIVENPGVVQHAELAPGDSLDLRWQPFSVLTPQDQFRLSVSEIPYHA